MNLDCFNNKTVLVTGATGLIGFHIIEKLLCVDGIKIKALGRSRKKLISTFGINGKLECVEHDISIPLPNVGKVDFIFHAASPISGEIIRTHPIDVINSNLSGVINCLEYLRAQEYGKIIIFSSATVYSNNSFNHIVREDMTNGADYIESFNSPYSESKRMVEVIANAYHRQYNVDILIARFSYVYGYSKNKPKTAFYEFINKAINGEAITLNKSNLPRRDNIYVNDAVDGLLHLCELGINGDVFNISSNGDKGNYMAIDEIAKLIAEVINKKRNNSSVEIRYSTISDEPRSEGLKLSNEKIKSTGWSISTSIEDGISETINKYISE